MFGFPWLWEFHSILGLLGNDVWQWGKHAKAIHTTSAAVNNEEIGGDTLQEQPLSHNSHKCQNKFDTQAAEIAVVRSELNKVLKEKQRLKICSIQINL